MALDFSPEVVREYPSELIQFVADGASQDAADVAELLTRAGVAPGPDRTIGIPPGILLDLGAVVRLRRWEKAGIYAHLEEGLLSASAAFRSVIDMLTTAGEEPNSLALAGGLASRVLGVRVLRFSWAGPSELDAEILLDTPTEEDFIDILAKFLWANCGRFTSTSEMTDGE